MKKIVIGINGTDYSYGNLGCQALFYSLINLLKKIETNNNIEIYYEIFNFKFFKEEKNKICKLFNIDCDHINYSIIKMKSLRKTFKLVKEYKKCDFIIDMSGGDSFSDIYGLKRMIKESFYKIAIINNDIPLILGPQTYGPYKNKMSKILAKYIFNNSALIFSRDNDSTELIEKITSKKIYTTTDIAMLLPYDKNLEKNNKIGINISALMWNGGYNKKQLNMKLDYKSLIIKIIEFLKENNQEICLISHVNSSGLENDYQLCKELANKYNIDCAPKFNDCIEAKNYISQLKLLIGSRMHATIAAFSSKTPTISIAYSKKFEGLYKTLNYDYFIDARYKSLEEAFLTIEKLIRSIDNMEKSRIKSYEIGKSKLEIFEKKLADITISLSK